MQKDLPPDANVQQTAQTVTLLEIFALFLQIGAMSFGGGIVAWLYREVVERRKWLTETDFLGGLTLSQVLPGINMTNMSVYIGQRLRGAAGAAIAVVGLLAVPFFAIIALGVVFAHLVSVPGVQHGMDGVAIAAVGLLLSIGARSVRNNLRELGPLAIIGTIVLTVGVLRWPMVPVVLCIAPISVALAWRRRRQPNA